MLISSLIGRNVSYRDKNGKLRRFGKVRSFVFHPTEKRVVGLLVKRPDIALMFHRKDNFVRLGGFSFNTDDNCLQLEPTFNSTGQKALDYLGITIDECILWWGMSVFSVDKKQLGIIRDVDFHSETGKVRSIIVDKGNIAQSVLQGKVEIPDKFIMGFKQGIGDLLAGEGKEHSYGCLRGAIVVSNEACELQSEGSTKDTSKQLLERAGKVAHNALFVTGKQLGQTKGMFKRFKEEFDKSNSKK